MSSNTATRNTASPLPSARLWTINYTLVCISAIVYGLGNQFLLPILPLYMKSFGGTDADVGLIFGTFSISGLASRLVAGWAIDRFGRKATLIVGTLIFLAGMPLYAMASTVSSLALLRLFHGLSAGTLTTVVPVLVADLVPASRRGEGLGYYGLSQSIASAIGPGIAVWLFASKGLPMEGFPLLFAACTIIGIVDFGIIMFVKETKAPKSATAAHPKFKWSMVINRAAIPLLITLCFVMFANGAMMSFVSLYLSTDNPSNVGLYFLISAVTMFISRPVVGSISDRINRRVVIIPLLILCAMGVGVYAISPTLPFVIAAAIIWGIGFGSINPTILAFAVDLVKPNERGAALATVQAALDIGNGIGSMVLAAVAQAAGYHFMFGVASFSCVLGLIYFLFYMRTTPYQKAAGVVAEAPSSMKQPEVGTSAAE